MGNYQTRKCLKYEMTRNASTQQGMDCLLSLKRYSRTEIDYALYSNNCFNK